MTAIEQLSNIHKQDLEKVHDCLLNILDNPVSIIPTLGNHILKAGGKRIRPLLTLTSAKIFSDPLPQSAIFLAAAVECIHTATLVHDDVLDDSQLRRGHPTTNALWGNTCSILVGDFLFAKAFELMVKSQNLNILSMLSKTSSKICQGEVKQLVMTNDIHALHEDYFDVIHHKTGALFESACMAGAMTTNASDKEVEALQIYGLNLGLAFQVIDDILDYAQSSEVIGKNSGDDYYDGKITLPIIELLKKDPSYADFFLNEDKQHFETIKNAMIKNDIFNICHKQAVDFTEKAIHALSALKKNSFIENLSIMAIELKERTY